jgi:hypothetical protein
MTLKPVLYTMLMFYAKKEHSPYIDTEAFLLFVEKYAQHMVNAHPEWTKWSKDASRKVWEELGVLIEEGKCAILTEKTGARIYLRRFYIDLLDGAYANLDEIASIPFPSEKYFKIKIPPEHLKSLNVSADMVVYLDNPQSELMPLIFLVFPQGLPGALVLSNMLPRRLSEAAMLKLRYFLRNKDNKDYLQNRLIPHYQDKEAQLRDLFNRILMRPMDCLNDLESGEDFPYMFWSMFCSLVRKDLIVKQDRLGEDIAVMQSSYILEIMNNYFRAKAFKRRERDLAFNDLDLEFDQPPYAFSMEAILKFTNSKGVPLLGLYSREDLRHWFEERIRFGSPAATLPEILLITGPADARRYIKKKHYFTFSEKLLNDARPVIRQAVTDRWIEILKDYRKELAMEKDEDYERLLQRFVGEQVPDLMAVMMDKKLYLVCAELEEAQGFIPENSRLFLQGGKLLPMATILQMKRQEVLTETKNLLPFWYSIPLVVALMALYHKLKNLRFARKRAAEWDVSRGQPSEKGSPEKEMTEAGRRLESEMVPFGEEIDAHLTSLENRWNTLLSKEARENLSTDVRTLVRDRLRQTLHGQRHIMLTKDSLEKLATRITEENKALRDLRDKDKLRQFIVLYMVKLLIQGKF